MKRNLQHKKRKITTNIIIFHKIISVWQSLYVHISLTLYNKYDTIIRSKTLSKKILQIKDTCEKFLRKEFAGRLFRVKNPFFSCISDKKRGNTTKLSSVSVKVLRLKTGMSLGCERMAKQTPSSEEKFPSGISAARHRFGLLHWQIIAICITVYDMIAVNAAYFLALWMRYDFSFGQIEKKYLLAFNRFMPIYTICCFLVFRFFKAYKSIWRFASFTELMQLIKCSLVTCVIHTAGITLLFCRMPISYYFLGAGIQFLLTVAIRFSYRFVLLIRGIRYKDEKSENAMIIGAGEAGQLLLRDMNRSDEYGCRACCIIDDNKNKWNRYMDGVPIVGGRDEILKAVRDYNIDVIFFAMPSAPPAAKAEILQICGTADCKVKQLPSIYTSLSSKISPSDFKDIQIEDLLGRDTIKQDMREVYEFIRNKVILVTGGGGSIGSELCRQIAAHNPKTLIIFDIYENSAYDIQIELKAKYPNLDIVTLIGSVRDSRRVNEIFEKYRPDIVYHAAAHKHVPLMEESPCEAIKNNAIGTYKTARAAVKYGTRRFVLISTDKAVNPTNVMGASKRICEMIIQTFDSMVKANRFGYLPALFTHLDAGDGEKEPAVGDNAVTEFAAVRFGNVLGSNGSVVPLFKRQIKNGGPVTVTHPDIIRYFMTIKEAVSLVLQAGVKASGGEIFVLDMGAPVKIDSLARNMIKLAGYKPDIDIKIEYCGLRPGEKLYEEKLMAEEGLRRTENELIHIGCPIPFDTEKFLKNLQRLMYAAYENDEDGIRQIVADTVTTYRPVKN